jgi:hypothetical protein
MAAREPRFGILWKGRTISTPIGVVVNPKFFPNHPENPAVFRTFPAKTFTIFRDYVDALPHITGCTGCNKTSEMKKLLAIGIK